MENFFDRSFTVYDSMLDTGEILNGGYIVAAVFASKADADAFLGHRSDSLLSPHGRLTFMPSIK